MMFKIDWWEEGQKYSFACNDYYLITLCEEARYQEDLRFDTYAREGDTYILINSNYQEVA